MRGRLTKKGELDAYEHDHCKAYVQWFRLKYPMLTKHLIHIPNEDRDEKQRIRKTEIGLVPGATDYLLALIAPPDGGLFLEMKAQDGKPSDDQRAFLQAMREAGYQAIVCFGVDQAIKATRAYVERAFFNPRYAALRGRL